MKHLLILLVLLMLTSCIHMEHGVCFRGEPWDIVYKVIGFKKEYVLTKVVKAADDSKGNKEARKVGDIVKWRRINKYWHTNIYKKVNCPNPYKKIPKPEEY